MTPLQVNWPISPLSVQPALTRWLPVPLATRFSKFIGHGVCNVEMKNSKKRVGHATSKKRDFPKISSSNGVAWRALVRLHERGASVSRTVAQSPIILLLHTGELSQQPPIKRDIHNGNRVQTYSFPNEYSNIYDLLSPTSDFVFYQIFGVEKHKSVLISLLNSILKGNPRVKDVRIDP